MNKSPTPPVSSSSSARPGIIERSAWLAHRLGAMGPGEIRHRIVEQLRRRFGQSMQGWSTFSLPDGPLPALPFDAVVLDRLSKALATEWGAQLRSAQAGTWTYLGCTWPGITGSGVWHLDPTHQHYWPHEAYCFDIPFRQISAVGDVKYVWELNRLQFLPAMAALARSRGHTKAYDYCLACIESWIDANPPFKGINWVSGIELAIRSVNLMLTVSLIGAEQIPPTIARKIRTALNAHAIWLAWFPSRFSSANNHLIAEAGALFILGTAMPDLPGAARYRAYGHATLVREAGKQILDDGVGAEQSPTYTGFTLEWYLLALSVARADGKTFPASVTERLHGAGIHLRWITDGAGNQPRIGDDDEGRVICCGPERQRHYVSGILSGLAVATGDPALAPPALHPHLRDAFLGAAPEHSAGPEGRRVFDTGGYTVFRRQLAGRQVMLVFDHGPLGYLPIAAHGHADALSVWLHLDGQPVLIDAGTYLYHSGGAMRDYFRGTRAHNTLTLDDQDQSRISAAFIWSRKAKCWRLPEPDAGGDRCVAGQHDGYLKRFGLLHQRRVCFGEPDTITIVDKLIGVPKSPDLTAQIRYHIAPYIDVTHREANQLDLAIDGALIATITLNMGSGGAPCPVRLVTSKISPQFGVISVGQCILSELPASDLLTAELNVRLCFKN